jgi:hypothetical protein
LIGFGGKGPEAKALLLLVFVQGAEGPCSSGGTKAAAGARVNAEAPFPFDKLRAGMTA